LSLFVGLLYGLAAADPVAFGGAMLLLMGTAVAAVIVPARRAAAVEPASVLREV